MQYSLGIDAQLVREANIVYKKDKFVVLCWDEMKFEEDLVFDSIVLYWIYKCWKCK